MCSERHCGRFRIYIIAVIILHFRVICFFFFFELSVFEEQILTAYLDSEN